jgi:hypothetical protein
MSAIDVYFEVALRQLDEQLQRVDSLDSKSAACVVFAATVLPVFGALLGLTAMRPPPAAIVLFVIAGAVFGGLAHSAYRAFKVQSWSVRPDPMTMKTHSTSGEYDEASMRMWVADEFLRSIEHNEPLLKEKARSLRWTIVLLAMEASILAIASLTTLLR